ncbi:MAG TPA: YbaK/EbsC family protein [Longimicrobiales bacterium]|nr:YbaK/EbsC family protein [Longimicrobiales bacterium]
MSETIAYSMRMSAPIEICPVPPGTVGPGEGLAVDIRFDCDSPLPLEQQLDPFHFMPLVELDVQNVPPGVSACVMSERTGRCHPLPLLVSPELGATLILRTQATRDPGLFAARPGTYGVRIRARRSSGTRIQSTSTVLTLTVLPFSLQPEQDGLTLQPGDTGSVWVHVLRSAGFRDRVELLPSENGTSIATAWVADRAAADAVELKVNVAPNTCPGAYAVEITGRSGHVVRSRSVKLNVRASSLKVEPASRAIQRQEDGMPMPDQLKKLLDQNGVHYQLIEHYAAFTAQEEAEAAHVPGRNWAKTVVVWVDDQPALTVLPANRKLDLEQLRAFAGAQQVKLAEESEFAKYYPDCEPGTMPPFGNLYGQRTFVDDTLREDETIAFHAGDHRTAVQIPYSAFERLADPIPGRFSHEPDE